MTMMIAMMMMMTAMIMMKNIHLGFWRWSRPLTLAGLAEGGGAIFWLCSENIEDGDFDDFGHYDYEYGGDGGKGPYLILNIIKNYDKEDFDDGDGDHNDYDDEYEADGEGAIFGSAN